MFKSRGAQRERRGKYKPLHLLKTISCVSVLFYCCNSFQKCQLQHEITWSEKNLEKRICYFYFENQRRMKAKSRRYLFWYVIAFGICLSVCLRLVFVYLFHDSHREKRKKPGRVVTSVLSYSMGLHTRAPLHAHTHTSRLLYSSSLAVRNFCARREGERV